MGQHDLIVQLQETFDDFRLSAPARRKAILPKIELICSMMQERSLSTYSAQCCSRVVNTCRGMAKLKQLKTYDDSKQVSHVLGDISFINIE